MIPESLLFRTGTPAGKSPARDIALVSCEPRRRTPDVRPRRRTPLGAGRAASSQSPESAARRIRARAALSSLHPCTSRRDYLCAKNPYGTRVCAP